MQLQLSVALLIFSRGSFWQNRGLGWQRLSWAALPRPNFLVVSEHTKLNNSYLQFNMNSRATQHPINFAHYLFFAKVTLFMCSVYVCMKFDSYSTILTYVDSSKWTSNGVNNKNSCPLSFLVIRRKWLGAIYLGRLEISSS